MTRIPGTLHEDQYTFFNISHSVLLIIRNISDKICTENQNTHYILNNFFFENPAIYEIIWKNIVEQDRPQITIWRMRIACWITKTSNTYSEYVILIAFQLQIWLRECASTLRYTYTGRRLPLFLLRLINLLFVPRRLEEFL